MVWRGGSYYLVHCDYCHRCLIVTKGVTAVVGGSSRRQRHGCTLASHGALLFMVLALVAILRHGAHKS